MMMKQQLQTCPKCTKGNNYMYFQNENFQNENTQKKNNTD